MNLSCALMGHTFIRFGNSLVCDFCGKRVRK